MARRAARDRPATLPTRSLSGSTSRCPTTAAPRSWAKDWRPPTVICRELDWRRKQVGRSAGATLSRSYMPFTPPSRTPRAGERAAAEQTVIPIKAKGSRTSARRVCRRQSLSLMNLKFGGCSVLVTGGTWPLRATSRVLNRLVELYEHNVKKGCAKRFIQLKEVNVLKPPRSARCTAQRWTVAARLCSCPSRACKLWTWCSACVDERSSLRSSS